MVFGAMTERCIRSTNSIPLLQNYNQTNGNKSNTTETRNTKVGKGKIWCNAISQRIQGSTNTSARNDTIIEKNGIKGKDGHSEEFQTTENDRSDTIHVALEHRNKISKEGSKKDLVDNEQNRNEFKISTISPNATKGEKLSVYDSDTSEASKTTKLEPTGTIKVDETTGGGSVTGSKGETDERGKTFVGTKVSSKAPTRTTQLIEKSDLDDSVDGDTNDEDAKSLEEKIANGAKTDSSDKTQIGIEKRKVARMIDDDIGGSNHGDKNITITNIGKFAENDVDGNVEEEAQQKASGNSSTASFIGTSGPRQFISSEVLLEKDITEHRREIEVQSNLKDDDSRSDISTLSIPLVTNDFNNPNKNDTKLTSTEHHPKEEEESIERVENKSKTSVDRKAIPSNGSNIGADELAIDDNSSEKKKA